MCAKALGLEKKLCIHGTERGVCPEASESKENHHSRGGCEGGQSQMVGSYRLREKVLF